MDILKVEQPFFSEAEQIAASHKLGTLQAAYTKEDEDRRLLLNAVVWMGISILGAIFVISLVFRLILPGETSGLGNYLTAAILAVIGFVILYGCFRQGQLNRRAYKYRNREQVHIYTDGMVYLEGQIAHLAVRWDQVVELTRGDIEDEASGQVDLDRIYLALKHDAEQQIFFRPALPQRLEICTRVEQAYTHARLPELLSRYEADERLDFDDLSISRAGVSVPHSPGAAERDDFAWEQIAAREDAIEVGQPYTTIKIPGKEGGDVTLFQEFTCEIANACLLKALLAELKHQ